MKGFAGKLVGSVYPITEEECARIHAAAVRVLEEGGMRCDDPRAARMFEAAGCTLENDDALIKIPEKVIMRKFLLKPSLIPTVSILGLDFAGTMGSAFLVEFIFNC